MGTEIRVDSAGRKLEWVRGMEGLAKRDIVTHWWKELKEKFRGLDVIIDEIIKEEPADIALYLKIKAEETHHMYLRHIWESEPGKPLAEGTGAGLKSLVKEDGPWAEWRF